MCVCVCVCVLLLLLLLLGFFGLNSSLYFLCSLVVEVLNLLAYVEELSEYFGL